MGTGRAGEGSITRDEKVPEYPWKAKGENDKNLLVKDVVGPQCWDENRKRLTARRSQRNTGGYRKDFPLFPSTKKGSKPDNWKNDQKKAETRTGPSEIRTASPIKGGTEKKKIRGLTTTTDKKGVKYQRTPMRKNPGSVQTGKVKKNRPAKREFGVGGGGKSL